MDINIHLIDILNSPLGWHQIHSGNDLSGSDS